MFATFIRHGQPQPFVFSRLSEARSEELACARRWAEEIGLDYEFTPDVDPVVMSGGTGCSTSTAGGDASGDPDDFSDR